MALQEHVKLFGGKKHRIFGKTRAEMFEHERLHLLALPQTPYQVATYLRALLSRDCHLRFGENYYSAPHGLRGLRLDVWATAKTVEIYYKTERVALHARGKSNAKFVTDTSHYPPAHQAYAEEDMVRLRERALKIGVATSTLIEELLAGPYPLQHFRRCQGILSLAHKYSWPGLEGAAVVANRFNQKTVHYLERVIKRGGGVLRKEGQAITRGHNPHLRGVDEILH